MEDIAEIIESQFVFYTPIFMYNVLSRGGMSERGQGARRVSAYREYW